MAGEASLQLNAILYMCPIIGLEPIKVKEQVILDFHASTRMPLVLHSRRD